MADGDDRDESESERLDRNWDELLQELRVIQTGVQLLSGFLLTLPFTQVFPSLDHGQKGVYLGLVVLSGLAVGVTLTPIALHRRVFREHDKSQIVRVGQVLSQVVIAAIALLITGVATLIFSVVTSWSVALPIGACVFVILAGLLVGLPTMVKRAH
jgi:hypothetical protein